MNALPRTILNTLATTTGNAPETLSTGGWTSMIVSVGSVTAIFVWCLWRVIRNK
ncbi:MAG: hypothetical protein LBD14_06015 [Puniceicoccales bacterium]|jgi:hypothetical protein|nr:hypothetical protein [Puniceicoccales bacterium]